MSRPTVAVLRPDDNRIVEAVEYLQSLGVSPISDPMLTVDPTGQSPQHADYCVFTSETGVDLTATAGWEQRDTTVCAVGDQTATALRNHEYSVDVVPSTFTSAGLVNELSAGVDGQTVELARSAHGSDVLVEGLKAAGATVHDTHLYRLQRPGTAGQSVSLAVDGELDGILFTSPKTVEHFFGIAIERDAVATLQRGLKETVVSAIGAPTERAVHNNGAAVDVMPDTVDFTRLAEVTVNQIQRIQR
ncbi:MULTISPECIES: uroporphyrinogen-III synthase [Natrialbaceae]|uniref:Uroporphyrinogen-III synthase n=1 Tax=Natrialba aegyptia DSM 13077 TaxID=1227491 RepID=M0APZ1_9EURY|nr:MULTISPECIES: uroporphyrinogen-III synthase [Natrialbaceae]ELY99987.1 uroporphyrinogen-III synthase [Natrialba aegyptia DSM 13077]UHQ98211.1 uroporphyrinogen-III synthase [Natrinema zhouii]